VKQIKFRAWDEQNKVMHNGFQFIKSGDTGNDWIIFKSDKHECFDRWVNNPYFSQQMKIMQYIGLTDDCDNDIYEGDIITIPSYSELFVVEYSEHICSFVAFNKNRDEGCYIISSDGRVIGNIYENPDLTK
jgi:uncharacterized phage protein (TIGR01671 family)